MVGGQTRQAYALCRPPGHHVTSDAYGGSCYLNNAALAAQALVDGGDERVSVIDVDAHHGNGTAAIFYERPDVFYGSVHHQRNDFLFAVGERGKTRGGIVNGSGFACRVGGVAANQRTRRPRREQRIAGGDSSDGQDQLVGVHALPEEPAGAGPDGLMDVLIELEGCQMRTRTPTRSSSALICWVACSPSMSGIRMSIMTTSARVLRTRSTACWPLAASPTTSRSGAVSISALKPARISPWTPSRGWH